MRKITSFLAMLLPYLIIGILLVETLLIATQYQTWKLGYQIQQKAVQQFLKK